MSFTLQIDDTSLLLLTSLILLSLLPRLFATTPAAHPLLFAKQSETSTVRRKGKTAVYRHWSTGSGGRLATRPEQGVDGVKELVKGGARRDGKGEGKRWIGGTAVNIPTSMKELERGLAVRLPGNEHGATNRIIICVPTTPTTLLPLVLLHLLPSSSTKTPTTNSDNGKKTQKYQIVTLSQPRYLTRALETFKDAKLIVASLEEINLVLGLLPSSVASSSARYLVVLPKTTTIAKETPLPADLIQQAQQKGYTLITFDEVLHAGRQEKMDLATEGEEENEGKSDPEAVHSFVFLPRATTLSDEKNDDDDPQTLTITNTNLTAGVTALLSLFPATHRPSSSAGGGKKDVFLTSVDLAQPFGLAVAVSALYVGADLVFVPPSQSIDELSLPDGAPQPTVAFLSPAQLRTLTSSIVEKAKPSLLYPIARRQAQARLRDGSVGRSAWGEGAVWRSARGVLAGGLRCLVIVGEKADDALSVSEVEEAFIHLAIPVIRTYINPRATAPVTATHFFDYQLVPYNNPKSANGKMHSGPPGSNTEIELRGEEVDRALEDGGDPRGVMYVRGPTVLRSFSTSDESTSTGPDDEEWVRLDATALARANGTFVAL